MIPSRAPFLLPAFFFLLPIHSIGPPASASAAIAVSFQTVAKGSRSGITEAAQITVGNHSGWTNLWHKHTALDTNPPPVPAIDFNKETVVAIFLGQKPTGGYAVEIMSVERIEGTLTITYREITPQPSGITTQAFTQPFHIVRVGVEGTLEVHFRRAP